ncbi:heme/hemin ABC transporter substrate-binding protein [Salininema proteolyticum]|uniref:Hemin ABC transporter substrate-binding protein n=1 Tax=Salininema proteolyticum TaxID=1607685 RepID=A0ABV8U4J9_9ACTN
MRSLPTLAAGLAALALTAMAGCGTPEKPVDDTADHVEPITAEADPDLPATAVDARGEEVVIERADRIAVASGAIAETVFSLGLGDRVVARDVTTTFDNADGLPVITKGHDLSAEGTLSTRPDLLLVEEATGPDTALRQIADAGVTVFTVPRATGIADVDATVNAVATALGVGDLGGELTAEIHERIEESESRVPEAGERPRVAFLYLRGSSGVYMIGAEDSGARSLIEAAGGVDAGSELEGDFVPLTPEAMAAMSPDAILVMDKGLDSVGGVDGLFDLAGLGQTPAAEERRVVSLPDGMMLNYGLRTDQVLDSFIDQLYGERR